MSFRLILAINLVLLQAPGYPLERKLPFTVADSIRLTQVLHKRGEDVALVSPDGKRFLVVLQRGDVARNGSWIELLMGDTESLATASHAKIVARLFSRSTVRASELAKNVRWLCDSKWITLLWD